MARNIECERRAKLYKALRDTLKEVFEVNNNRTMNAKQVWSCLPPHERKYWSPQSISKRLLSMKNIKVVTKKDGCYYYKLIY